MNHNIYSMIVMLLLKIVYKIVIKFLVLNCW